MSDLTVASWNIHKGVGGDRRRDLGRTAAVIAEIGADILALQEADTRFGTRTGLLDLDRVRRENGLVPVPLQDVGPAHGWHGNLLLVRNALVQVVHQIDLPGLEPRGALIADLVTEAGPLRVIAAHLGLLPHSRGQQTAALLHKIGTLDARPTLLMGDLNEWRGASGVALGHLARHFQTAPAVKSFPARYPVLPLDRVMIGGDAHLTGLATHVSPLSRRASDHLPLTARLRLPQV